MVERKHSSGFSLVELMAVVAILGILAVVAVAAYSRYVDRAHEAEAIARLSDVRLKQEAYRGTFSRYADLSNNGAARWLPSPGGNFPGPSTVTWPNGGDDTAWRQLGAAPAAGDNQHYTYAGVAGVPGAEAPFAPCDTVSTADFWYCAVGLHDIDGNGTCAGFVVFSNNTTMMKVEEGSLACPTS